MVSQHIQIKSLQQQPMNNYEQKSQFSRRSKGMRSEYTMPANKPGNVEEEPPSSNSNTDLTSYQNNDVNDDGRNLIQNDDEFNK